MQHLTTSQSPQLNKLWRLRVLIGTARILLPGLVGFMCFLSLPSQASPPRPFEAREASARAKLRLLSASNRDLRALAARDLVSVVDTVCREALPVLAARVRVDTNVNVRLEAVRALARIAAACDRSAAEKALKPATRDKSPDVQDQARRALSPSATIRPLACQLAALKAAGIAQPRALTRSEGRPRRTLFRQRKLLAQARHLLPSLIKLLRHRDACLRAGATMLLRALGPRARPAASALARSLGDPQAQVAVAATEALTAIGSISRRSLTALLRAQTRGTWETRRAVNLALGHLTKRREAITALIHALADPIDAVAAAAAVSLRRLRPAYSEDKATGKKVIRALGRAIASAGFSTRVMGLDALGAFGSTGASEAPQVVTCLLDPVSRVRETALWCVGCMGPAVGARAIAPLRHLLKGKNITLCRGAADALGKLGALAGPAVPELITLLKHRERQLRSAAVLSLGHIGPQAQKALPTLRKLLKDPTMERSWVKRAIVSISASH